MARSKILPIVIYDIFKRLRVPGSSPSRSLRLSPSDQGLVEEFPDDVSYEVIRVYLQSQSLRTALMYRCTSRAVRDMIDHSMCSGQLCHDDVWLVSPLCKRDTRGVHMEVLDLRRAEQWRIALPEDLQNVAAAEFCEGNTLRLRSASGPFGSRLVILEIFGSSSSSSNRPRHRFVFNPVNRTSVRLPLSYPDETGHRFYNAQQIGRFKNTSEYLVWAETHPQIVVPRNGISRHVPSAVGFRSNGTVQLVTASIGDKSYFRYEANELRNLVIEYDLACDILSEKETQGLPENLNSKYDYLFAHHGTVHLASVLSGPKGEVDEIVVFKMESDLGQIPQWTEISRVPPELLAGISGSYSPRIRRGVRFILVKTVLSVIAGRMGSPRLGRDILPTVLAYDFARELWTHDDATSMLSFDFQALVLRPRFDVQA